MSEDSGSDFPVTKPVKGSKVVIGAIVIFVLMVPVFSWGTKAFADFFASHAPKSTLGREVNDERMKQVEQKEAARRGLK